MSLAVLPGGAGVVSISNVNCTANCSFHRNNHHGESNQTPDCVNQNLDVQHDGLTTVLTASDLLNAGVNAFEFLIFGRGDSSLDSGVFIKAGSFTGVNETPEPDELALMGLGLAAAAAAHRRKSARSNIQSPDLQKTRLRVRFFMGVVFGEFDRVARNMAISAA